MVSILRPRPARQRLSLLSLLTGVAYPHTTGVAQALSHHRAAGGLMFRDGEALGSELIGQAFSDPRYFWSRPSATTPKA
ncbi:potassium-transporting ATPase subunit C, partial [Pseudomonas sp. LFM046]|uniref:potassium-transporting ATPase subunit C n=1 Tax=Pseudomonas sp. LFM046 TaxID=1608357 RepID=UPI0005CFC625